jgi:hypothetical protein
LGLDPDTSRVDESGLGYNSLPYAGACAIMGGYPANT